MRAIYPTEPRFRSEKSAGGFLWVPYGYMARSRLYCWPAIGMIIRCLSLPRHFNHKAVLCFIYVSLLGDRLYLQRPLRQRLPCSSLNRRTLNRSPRKFGFPGRGGGGGGPHGPGGGGGGGPQGPCGGRGGPHGPGGGGGGGPHGPCGGRGGPHGPGGGGPHGPRFGLAASCARTALASWIFTGAVSQV